MREERKNSSNYSSSAVQSHKDTLYEDAEERKRRRDMALAAIEDEYG